MIAQSNDFLKNNWFRFKKNKPAIIGLVIIFLAVMIALFGYIIAPDNTTNADIQTVEIQAKNPGYKQLFLVLNNKTPTPESFIHILLFGKTSFYNFIPITKWETKKDELWVDKYIDDDTCVKQQYSINEITNGHPKELKKHFIEKKYLLGTDHLGRDILSRLIIGTRVSISVGFIAVLVSVMVGLILGTTAGYFGKRTDTVIMWIINVCWSIPTLLLVFAFTIALGKGFWQIFFAIGLTLWINVARMVRGQVMSIKKSLFIDAARVMGFSSSRIIIRHILPNLIGPLIVITASNFSVAIVMEAGLSFLGIGIQSPMPSWGLMIKENYTFIITNKAFLAFVPGISMMLLVLAFNLVGNGLRDAFDVKAT
jgi:peptide/nickel transport system permease protein